MTVVYVMQERMMAAAVERRTVDGVDQERPNVESTIEAAALM
jgi:hypothetical protein